MTDAFEHAAAALRGDYRLEGELGSGGMATVFLAHDLKHDRRVAIKVLRPEIAAALGPDRFLHEIRITGNLQHPHILPLYDSGVTTPRTGTGDGRQFLYYVTPYIEGDTLRDRIDREGRLSLQQSLDLASHLAGALDYAHRQGLVHRDLKPENVLFQDGEPLLADFGIALDAGATVRLTETGLAIGTPHYMSPEQAAGDREVDTRSDVYALGCLVYEMLAGEPPFTGSSAQAIIARHIKDAVPPLGTVRADVPAPVAQAVHRALAKAPADRFATAGEFRDALHAPTSGTAAARLPMRRIGLAAGLAVLSIAGFFALRDSGPRQDPRRSIIVFPFDDETGRPEDRWLRDASGDLLSLALAHWEELRVIDDERTASLMRRAGMDRTAPVDFADAQALAGHANVGTFVLGDLRRSNDSLFVEAKIYDASSGERIATQLATVPDGTDPRTVFDVLAADILQLSGATDLTMPGVVRQTTRSLEAYRSYLAGSDALMQFRLDSAAAAFNRAVTLDSTFALAHFLRERTETWRPTRGDANVRRRHLLAARANATHLSPRIRALLTIAQAQLEGDWVRARELAATLVAADSTDAEAWFEYGEGEFHSGAEQFFNRTEETGELVPALKAFRRAIELDSSFFLPYSHIVDVTRACVRPISPVACLPDSTIYAPWDVLDAEVGLERLRAIREDLLDAGIRAARAWAAAAPESPQPSRMLVHLFLDAGRFPEAMEATNGLRALGLDAVAMAYQAQALFSNLQFREAAVRMQDAATRIPDARLPGELAMYASSPILASAGRVTDATNALRRFYQTLPSFLGFFFEGDGGVKIVPNPVWSEASLTFISAGASLDSGAIARTVHTYLEELRANVGDRFGAVMSRQGPLIASYLVSRDTLILAQWLNHADSILWPGAQAQLLLARGDTTGALALLDEHYVANAPLAPGPFPAVSSFTDYAAERVAWADLLNQLGRHDDALVAYASMDRVQLDAGGADLNAGMIQLSWAERAAIYQRQGDTTSALVWYRRFVEQLRDGEGSVRDLVVRAHQAIAAITGEPAPPRR